jgi:glycosyltransferase involved in cell wall biosynthesis
MNLADLTLVLGQETARSLRQGNDDLRIEGVTVPVPTAGLRAQMGAFEAGGPMGSRPARLMFLGQAHAGKGVRELVMACRQLDGQGFTLTVVGPITGKMRSVLLELAGPESERWLAVKGELPRAEALAELGSSDILILPSTWTTEAFPAVVLEAMACGRCVVASDRGAVREMLAVGTPDECGVLVEPGNVGHLARVLQSLLAAPARVAELGQNGRRRVMQNYDAPVVVGHLMRHWFPALTPAAAVSRGASATPAEAPTDECTPKAMPAHFTAGVVSR